MAGIPNDQERFKRQMDKIAQSAVDGLEIVKHVRKYIEKAFQEGYVFGQEELLNHAKKIVEVEERQKVDGVLLGAETHDDEIPF